MHDGSETTMAIFEGDWTFFEPFRWIIFLERGIFDIAVVTATVIEFLIRWLMLGEEIFKVWFLYVVEVMVMLWIDLIPFLFLLRSFIECSSFWLCWSLLSLKYPYIPGQQAIRTVLSIVRIFRIVLIHVAQVAKFTVFVWLAEHTLLLARTNEAVHLEVSLVWVLWRGLDIVLLAIGSHLVYVNTTRCCFVRSNYFMTATVSAKVAINLLSDVFEVSNFAW